MAGLFVAGAGAAEQCSRRGDDEQPSRPHLGGGGEDEGAGLALPGDESGADDRPVRLVRVGGFARPLDGQGEASDEGIQGEAHGPADEREKGDDHLLRILGG